MKEFFLKAKNWVQRLFKSAGYQPHINDDGLISPCIIDSAEVPPDEQTAQNSQVVVKPVQAGGKTEPLERMQAGFDKLVENLQDIREHLNQQIVQREMLINQINKLPELLESLPSIVKNQEKLTEQLIEQVKTSVTKEQQFIDAVEKIPIETGRQTDALVNIDHQLAAAADADVQMVEGFNKFNETVNKLNQNITSQADSIMQMNRTFAASDRYLKYLITKQNKRLMWLFIFALGICALVIFILTVVIAYLKSR
jgi:uncharacterized protein (DUF3084 family)